jgi:hypothetical protein
MQGVLEITILRAFLSRDICPYNNMNPYFTTSLSNNKTHISKPHFNGNHSPYWDETFYFHIDNHSILSLDILHENEIVTSYINPRYAPQR